MKLLMLGAGASKAYSDSKEGVRMPIAWDFLETFAKLSIARNPWVLTGDVLCYARDHRGIPVEDFYNSHLDIEDLHTQIEQSLIDAVENAKSDSRRWIDVLLAQKTFVQFIFMFAAAINAIQNGPTSKPHLKVARTLSPDDVILTFNWDTLMDRALAEGTDWTPDEGYGFRPRKIHRNGWEEPVIATSTLFPTLLKLHGSTNWLTSYPIVDRNSLTAGLIQTTPAETVHVYEGTLDPYPTHAGRFMPGFERYSYGYYPPNIPDDPGISATPGHVLFSARLKFPWSPEGGPRREGLPASPLIIPPVKEKSYSMFGSLFTELWDKAKHAIRKADEIAILGYSFPRTDVRTIELFRDAFCQRTSIPHITIVNPSPEHPFEVFTRDLGVPTSHVHVLKEYFTDAFDVSRIWQSS